MRHEVWKSIKLLNLALIKKFPPTQTTRRVLLLPVLLAGAASLVAQSAPAAGTWIANQCVGGRSRAQPESIPNGSPGRTLGRYPMVDCSNSGDLRTYRPTQFHCRCEQWQRLGCRIFR
jgi:hypothetical protein